MEELEVHLSNSGERSVPSELSSWEFKRVYNLICKLRDDKEASVLDYGCGSGYGAYLLREYYSKVVGIDVSIDAIDYCKTKYVMTGLSYSVINGVELPFEPNSFDLVTSIQVLEHIAVDQVKNYIKNIYLLIKPGGSAIITTPNAYNYFNNFSGNPFHKHEYTLVEVRALIASVINEDEFDIYAFWDVPTNILYLYLQKLLRQKHVMKSLLNRLIGFALRIPRLTERKLFAGIDPERYLEKAENHMVWGSHFIYIKKAVQ
jgi:2-polyprenyl-3-methyl-5-hydroxy-6-metoxy-1,4-benzoquinol methylase